MKSFLRLRGLKTTGEKEELVARVFVAIENDVPLTETAEEVGREIVSDYKPSLKSDERHCQTLSELHMAV